MPKFAKKSYQEEAILPISKKGGTTITNPNKDRRPPQVLNTQFLAPQTDMERLIEKGLQNPEWLMRLLTDTSMESVLKYAEKKISICPNMKQPDKERCLEIINNHPVRMGKGKAFLH